MKSRLVIFIIAAVSLVLGLMMVNAQSDDDVRGAFLSTRPKTTNANTPRRPRPRPHPTPNNSSSGGVKNTNNTNGSTQYAANNNKSLVNINSGKSRAEAIALGYTIFMRDVNGRAVRVEPTREFHNGDRIRISLEPNVDGYVYVFHTEGDGPPEMIYPDARLDGGDNSIEAHVPIEIPSTLETDERLQWFQFYGNAATEHLYVIVTREPLADVPIGEVLVKLCTDNKANCPWHPPVDVWMRTQQAAKAEVKVVTNNTAGQAQSDKEQLATTRGFGLDQTAPQPAVIRMSASTTAPVLVTVLDLVHK